jgi:Uma2 family endonuclease
MWFNYFYGGTLPFRPVESKLLKVFFIFVKNKASMKTISTEYWTYERMLSDLPAESHYELRDFNLIEMPSPKRIHQRIVGHCYIKLAEYLKSKALGEVFVSPFDVILDRGNVCQPDLLFLSNEKSGLSTENGIMGAPDLIVEVVSKGSVVRDYVEKKNDYEGFGVSEYWIIDPMNETIIVNVIENGKYKVFSSVEEPEAIAASQLLDGFTLSFEEVFGPNS